MSWKSDKIVIVGGGSAGWMSAATLIRFFPNKDITLIETPDIPIMGVGESTLGEINTWLNVLGISDRDFMKATDASYKLSIKFTDFLKKNSGGFHYPFGEPQFLEKKFFGIRDWQLKKYYYPDTPVQDFCRTFYPSMQLIENNKISENIGGELGSWRFDADTAYHFDATKFANWLREKYCIPKGVKHLPVKVRKVNSNADGIKELILDNGDVITADLYVDCTGWKSLLIGKSLQVPFISYSDIIPNNRAWATQVPYVDKEKELEPYTNCTAIENGWVWNIPLWSRIGTGYVYSDKYISKEDALEQFKHHLRTRMTIPNAERITDDLKFKDIEMRIGIYDRPWEKNVVSIGLSCGFIEPLESNGLLTVHVFLLKLIKFLGREVVTRWDQDVYNSGVKRYFKSFAEFVAMHYALSVRTDTEYWREISKKSFCPSMVNSEFSDVIGFDDFARKKFNQTDYNNYDGITTIGHGMEYYNIDESVISAWSFLNKIDYKHVADNLIPVWNEMQNYWKGVADSSPTLYEYLKTNIYE
jgi:hypothetical protein